MSQVPMVDFGELGFALYISQSVANLLLALVLFGLHRLYRRGFLLHWGLSWSALAIYHVTCAASSGAMHELAPGHPLKIAVGSLVLSAGFAQLCFLVSGTWLLVTGRALGRGVLPYLFLAPLLLAVATVVGTLELDPPARLFARFGLRSLLGALAFLGASLGVARAVRKESSVPRWLVVLFLFLAGAAQLRQFLVQVDDLDGSVGETLARLAVPHFADLFLQMTLLLGLLLWFFEDERRKLALTAQALLRSEDHLRRSEHMEAVGRLAGGVAHDFNNLLTAIAGHAELLLARTGETHADREDLVPIVHASSRAAELVRELLTFSRRQPLRPRRFVLDGLLGDMRKMVERLIGESVRLELRLGAPLAVVHADPAQIELALINLATNARDAITGNGEFALRTSTVEVAPHADPVLAGGTYLLLEVSDTGCGIPARALDKVFEPFYTTKPGKGTGLGLASVYGIVKQSAGEIRVESAVGHGTTFRIWLPVVSAPAEDSGELVPASFARGGSETILLVEDEPQVRHLALRLLVKAGYRVIAAENGDDACERVVRDSQDIRLLLSDVVMPGLPVLDLVEHLRKSDPELRVLLMSGYSEAAVQQHGIEFASVLAKPFSAQTLLAAVRAALDAPRPQAVRA